VDPAYEIRPIRREDDAAVAAIIRAVMPEFGAGGQGFAIHDAEVDAMTEAYAAPRCAYFVVVADGRVLGGGGVAPLLGGEAHVCELKKMYFRPEARGLGLGQAVLTKCLDAARSFGFTTCYLETLGTMVKARALYERNGFQKRNGPAGATGHFGCDAWYDRAL
jgi:putative acetyltransferase